VRATRCGFAWLRITPTCFVVTRPSAPTHSVRVLGFCQLTPQSSAILARTQIARVLSEHLDAARRERAPPLSLGEPDGDALRGEMTEEPCD